ncbi:Flagellar protein FliT [Bacillus sp. THAF10]|uniref:hypothetical protein n=1 Tax=Bacillus sp. THAF10 TaxID=2587848 RepID=UPI001268A14C|nr:hypothetical protein [Bacillus sp. THAF10]QFT90638.1 Flagellar protein FliT [Bacillus sp. THAF10]
MGVVKNLEKVTIHLLTLLERPLPSEDEKRESFIEEIDKVLELRDQLISTLSPPFSEEEMMIGKKIALASQSIPSKLEAYQKQLKKEWGQVQQSRKSVRAYGKPYNAPTADGMYYDKRN